MIVQSDLLGALPVAPEEVIDFPGGLLGFPAARSFVLLPTDRGDLYWLQSLDHRPFTLLLADPFACCEGYAVELSAEDGAELGAESPADLAVLSVVTLPRARRERPTVSLHDPLVLNLRLRIGKQLAVGADAPGPRRAPAPSE